MFYSQAAVSFAYRGVAALVQRYGWMTDESGFFRSRVKVLLLLL